MKRVAVIALFIVAGLFCYHYFQGDTDDTIETEYAGEEFEEPQEPVYAEEMRPTPGSCQDSSVLAENAMYGAAIHSVSFAQRNSAVRKFMSCLRDEGFSDDEVNAAMEVKKEKVGRYLKMDKEG